MLIPECEPSAAYTRSYLQTSHYRAAQWKPKYPAGLNRNALAVKPNQLRAMRNHPHIDRHSVCLPCMSVHED
jgi:hypothetical protein